MWVTRVSINNPVFATMVMVGIVVLGLFSYTRLRVEQMPDVVLPYVLIETAYPGASPEVIESDVTKPIEYAANTVSGVKRIFSNSREGQSQVFVEFRLGTDATRAIQDVRDKIAAVRPGFPRDVKEPLVVREQIDESQPAVSLAVLSPTVGLRELTSLTDQTIVKSLENIPGVARVDVNGRVTRQILIQIKPLRTDRARHRHRSGDERDPGCQPGRGRRPGHARAERCRGARRGQDQGSDAVRPHHRRAAGRRPCLSEPGRRRHRWREGARFDLAHQRQAFDHHRHPESAGRQHRSKPGAAYARRWRRSSRACRPTSRYGVVYSQADEVQRGIDQRQGHDPAKARC